MVEWWSNIEGFEKVFWYFAIPFTVVFVIQLILTFAGMGDEGDADGFDDDIDFDEDGGLESSFQFFTIRNFITFFTVFGWAGIAVFNSGAGKVVTTIVAAILGLIVMGIVAGLFYLATKLTESGNMNLKNAVGATGEVYIPIPKGKSGVGKIQITLQGSLREIDAMTEGKEISTGTMIKVVGFLNDQILLVEKI